MRLIIIALLIAIALPVYAKSGEVTEFSLQNGLKVFIKEDHRAPIVIAQALP